MNDYISIFNNEQKIQEFIRKIIIHPRSEVRKWSEITRQTPSFKIGYIGQHLASLISGVQGSGSAARGDDLMDGTEVKSCNKIDQLDKCKNCGEPVLRYENKCRNCNSQNICRKQDSKWLFSIRNEGDLEHYLTLNRIILIIMDYPDFNINNFNKIRIRAFEIYPKNPECSVFVTLLRNHYYNIYVPKNKAQANTNPMNLHPYSYQFYKCHPKLVFSCSVDNCYSLDDSEINIEISHFDLPNEPRNTELRMPTNLLQKNEWKHLNYNQLMAAYKLTLSKSKFLQLTKKEKSKLVPELDPIFIDQLPLRKIISSVRNL